MHTPLLVLSCSSAYPLWIDWESILLDASDLKGTIVSPCYSVGHYISVVALADGFSLCGDLCMCCSSITLPMRSTVLGLGRVNRSTVSRYSSLAALYTCGPSHYRYIPGFYGFGNFYGWFKKLMRLISAFQHNAIRPLIRISQKLRP
ncbi:hypothetical protein F4808DRAFT_405974 [Astrocystis sublimbata]|nr:hypothetical protein F4808DRAFT_405974 [Astrocystis sublimbata]